MTQYDFGWLVGWLEGEGTFHCSIQAPVGARKAYKRLTVRAVSVDYDTVLRAQKIAGGKVFGPYQHDKIRQPHYQWNLGGSKSGIAEFMELIRPQMGTRRQQQIDRALERAYQ